MYYTKQSKTELNLFLEMMISVLNIIKYTLSVYHIQSDMHHYRSKIANVLFYSF